MQLQLFQNREKTGWSEIWCLDQNGDIYRVAVYSLGNVDALEMYYGLLNKDVNWWSPYFKKPKINLLQKHPKHYPYFEHLGNIYWAQPYEEG